MVKGGADEKRGNIRSSLNLSLFPAMVEGSTELRLREPLGQRVVVQTHWPGCILVRISIFLSPPARIHSFPFFFLFPSLSPFPFHPSSSFMFGLALLIIIFPQPSKTHIFGPK